MNQLELDRHHELAEFLRSRRARLSPEQVGLSRGLRRRTPGLRREEVAMLAGVSPEWYTWLEQGRDINVSVQVLDSLAKVLQLDNIEREHLFLLAQRRLPPVETFSAPTISPALEQFLNQLRTSPTCVVDARLNVLRQNIAHRVVFGDFSILPERERNLIWRIFTPAARQVNEQWEQLARRFLAQFRAGYGRFINDPWWVEQIAELSAVSPEFRELWNHHDVLNPSEGQKTIHLPVIGKLTFDILWLQTVDPGDLRLLIHTPCNPGTLDIIEQLLSNL
ncbi:MAG: helix-turn-helix transcriptional regulator [Anaerolineae bacterium]